MTKRFYTFVCVFCGGITSEDLEVLTWSDCVHQLIELIHVVYVPTLSAPESLPAQLPNNVQYCSISRWFFLLLPLSTQNNTRAKWRKYNQKGTAIDGKWIQKQKEINAKSKKMRLERASATALLVSHSDGSSYSFQQNKQLQLESGRAAKSCWKPEA